ncbi:MAG: bifunctional metallophosphatase/5'-nucleotidase [Rhizobacter sp.]
MFHRHHLAIAVAATAVCAAAVLAVPQAHAAEPTPTISVKIIGFNDFHGTLLTPGSFSPATQSSTSGAGLVPAGGADYLAGFVSRLKAQNPLNAVVGAGDIIGASPLVSALFHDEPTVEVMNRLGLDFNAVGNHEFDKGSVELLRLQKGGCATLSGGAADPNSCKGASVGTPTPFEGAKFKWLSANVFSTATGKTLLPPYGIKTFDGVRVAFIGMTLRDTPTIVTPTGVAGLEFHDEADTVNALVPKLRALGVESIVVLVHQGGFQSGSNDINGCAGNLAGSAIAEVVGRLDNAVDLVISGHTHTAYNCKLPNAAGRLVPVTQASAFGRVVSDIDLTIDRASRDVMAVVATNRVVDRSDSATTPNATVGGIVTAYNTLVSPIANAVIGSITQALPNTASDGACNMPAGDLIADAQLAATAPAQFGGAQFAFMNRGGVRNPGFTFASSAVGEGDGNITYGEAFTTQPFGNSLVTITLTAKNIKDALEQQFAGCRGQSATATRILIPSTNFRYTWDGSAACDARIRNVMLTTGAGTETLVDASGLVPDPLKTYRVTINNFLSTGGDGFSTFLSGTQLLGGAQDIDALVAYLSGYKAPNPVYDSVAMTSLGSARMTRVNAPAGSTTCPGGAVVNP